jgi:hypothetical protein
MDIQDITDFFMWCALINEGLLLLWSAFILFAPDTWSIVFKPASSL